MRTREIARLGRQFGDPVQCVICGWEFVRTASHNKYCAGCIATGSHQMGRYGGRHFRRILRCCDCYAEFLTNAPFQKRCAGCTALMPNRQGTLAQRTAAEQRRRNNPDAWQRRLASSRKWRKATRADSTRHARSLLIKRLWYRERMTFNPAYAEERRQYDLQRDRELREIERAAIERLEQLGLSLGESHDVC
jgi:hypothetical protein